MIRYYIEGISQQAAGLLQVPALRRLVGRGPWACTEAGPSTMCLQRGDAPVWGEIRPGLGGLRYQLADPLPDLAAAVAVRLRGDDLVWVDIGGHRLPIRLATHAPVRLGFDGLPEGPADEYGTLAQDLWDRAVAGELTAGDPDLVRWSRLALMSASNLTDELCHAYGLITTDSTMALFRAGTGLGKAPADGG